MNGLESSGSAGNGVEPSQTARKFRSSVTVHLCVDIKQRGFMSGARCVAQQKQAAQNSSPDPVNTTDCCNTVHFE